jgi:hypothetical protein
MANEKEIIKKLASAFDGLDRAYGTFNITGVKEGSGKKTGKAATVAQPVTLDLWKSHTDGKVPIGIVPIRDDNNCVFGAIDIDSYTDFDPSQLDTEINKDELPVVVCRSKSGGAHIYLFTYEPVPASLMRSKLLEIALSIGYPDAEIFPKQDRLASKEDTGNWINMPYFSARKTDRYAFEEGYPVNLERFVQIISERSLSQRELQKLEMKTSEFSDAPPCIEKLCLSGFPKGSMNNALFDLGVFARMKFPDEWQQKVAEYNQRFLGPGTPSEVQQVIKSLDKKKYIYKCLEDPICGVCNKAICANRKFGISSPLSPYKTTSGQKALRPCILDEVQAPIQCFVPPDGSDDEPYWVFTIHGMKMDVSIDMVQAQNKFLREYLKKFHKMLLPIDETRWMVAINDLLLGAEVSEMAEDAGPEGQFWIHLENFCTGKVQARNRDELLLGKPWFDRVGESGNADRVYFRSQDLMKYLDTQRFKTFNIKQIYAILRRGGAGHHKFTIKGTCISAWHVKAFPSQTEGFDVPDVSQQPVANKVEEF